MNRFLLTIFAILSALTTRADTITYAFTNAFGGVLTNAVRVQQVDGPYTDGTFRYYGLPRTLITTNGLSTNTLGIGNYQAYPVGFTNNPLYFQVPGDGGTYTALSLRIGGGNFFAPSGVVQAVAGSGISMSPTNGKGIVTLSTIAPTNTANNPLTNNLNAAGFSVNSVGTLNAANVNASAGINSVGQAQFSANTQNQVPMFVSGAGAGGPATTNLAEWHDGNNTLAGFVNSNGVFGGNGSLLTSISIPTNVVVTNEARALNFGNAANTFTGTHSGNGSALTNLPASAIATGNWTTNIYWIATNGNDSTAIAGRYDLPFLTYAAADTAATGNTNAVIQFGPGSWFEQVAPKTGQQVKGSGRGKTFIVNYQSNGTMVSFNADNIIVADLSVIGTNNPTAAVFQFPIKINGGHTNMVAINLDCNDDSDCFYGNLYVGSSATTFDAWNCYGQSRFDTANFLTKGITARFHNCSLICSNSLATSGGFGSILRGLSISSQSGQNIYFYGGSIEVYTGTNQNFGVHCSSSTTSANIHLSGVALTASTANGGTNALIQNEGTGTITVDGHPYPESSTGGSGAIVYQGENTNSPINGGYLSSDANSNRLWKAGTTNATASTLVSTDGSGQVAGSNFITSGVFQNTNGNARYYQAQKTTTLTNTTAITIANVTIASGKHFGARLIVNSFSTDGTDLQTLNQSWNVTAVNKAGTVTGSILGFTGSGSSSVSAGTFSNTSASVAANGNSLDIKITPNSSLTPTTMYCSFVFEVVGTDDPGLTITQK